MRELLTGRLRLRYITEADTRRIYDCWASDPEVTKFLTWDAHTNLGQTEGYMNYVLNEYKKEDTYRWGIELKETGEPISRMKPDTVLKINYYEKHKSK